VVVQSYFVEPEQESIELEKTWNMMEWELKHYMAVFLKGKEMEQ
jgi:hypothetical protein